MRRSIGIAGLAFTLLVCQDRLAPTPLSPLPRPHMARDGSRSDFDFTAATAAGGSRGDATMLAIVDHAFANGEVARAVREPGAATRGIVVLSAAAFDDHALFLATSALDLDIRGFPSVAEPRVLRVWDDGRVTSDADGLIGRVDLSLLPAERTTGILEYLGARSADEETVDIPRIGHARLMKF